MKSENGQYLSCFQSCELAVFMLQVNWVYVLKMFSQFWMILDDRWCILKCKLFEENVLFINRGDEREQRQVSVFLQAYIRRLRCGNKSIHYGIHIEKVQRKGSSFCCPVTKLRPSYIVTFYNWKYIINYYYSILCWL